MQRGGICMSLIDVRNLSFYYEGSYDYIFENVNLQMDTRWRLGLVGRNGRGKNRHTMRKDTECKEVGCV